MKSWTPKKIHWFPSRRWYHESFRPKLKAALIKGELRKDDAERKSSARRKPWYEVVIVKALVLQAAHNLSNDHAEYQLRDRYSFGRFPSLGIEDRQKPLAHARQREQ